MEPKKKHDQIARYLHADTPRVTVDDRFITVLADLARASTPSSERPRLGKTALRIRIAAATASVALVLVGAAYAVDQLGGEQRPPVGPTDTVDPASPPSEPDEQFEEPDEDVAPHHLDEGREHHPGIGAGSGVKVDPGEQGHAVDGGTSQAPAPPSQPGPDPVAPAESDPNVNDSSGSSAPHDDADPAENADPRPDVDPRPEADPDDPEIDADGASGSGPADAPDADLDSDPGDAG